MNRRLVRAACSAAMVLSAPLYFHADYVWGECGYDCAIMGQGYIDGRGWGPAAVVALYFAVILFLVSATWLATSHVKEWRQKKAS